MDGSVGSRRVVGTMSAPHNDNRARGDDDEAGDLSGEAAGVARGVSRSLGRSVFRAPVGGLPKPSGAMLRAKIPIQRVARVSDRVATGLDWWSSATEGHEGTASLAQRTKLFGQNLLKNTLLGFAVFESYGYIIRKFAPAELDPDATILPVVERTLMDEESGKVVLDEPDEYARASLSLHYGAGSLAGSIHGLASSILDGSGSPTGLARFTLLNTIHHSVAHSLLFGGYESIKRLLVTQLHEIDGATQYYGGAYLTAFGIAGGIAGQLQHLASHYTEHWLGLDNASLRLQFRVPAPIPAMRPLLYAFPPSAIGFIAFEYGKKFATS